MRSLLLRAARPLGHRASQPLWLGAAGAASLLAASGGLFAEEERKRNAILSPRHRVCITNWSIVNPRAQGDLDETAKSLRGNFMELCMYLKRKGYEGLEITTGDLRRGGYFPETAGDDEIVSTVLAACQRSGVRVVGSLLHIADGGPAVGSSDIYGLDYTREDFWENLERTLVLEKRIGSEYASFQIELPEDKKATGGAYRSDEAYLQLCADRVHRIQQLCFKHGMNFYVETHIDRISEDPEAFCKIFDLCPSYFEVNADISHYLYRNINCGPHYDRIVERIGHCHIRMARKHGDLSSVPGVQIDRMGKVGDAHADWEDKGVTWQAMEAMRPALLRGLSSRAVTGEAGPAFCVKDGLDLDTQLVPLYRAMVELADRKREPEGNPWGKK